ncbi:hypothetical protein BH23CHL7_BH23CHL7_11640 [soil metagenome]|jgi:hypothetical protein
MTQALATSRPLAIALRVDGSVAAVMPTTDLQVLVLRKLEVIGLELISLIRLIGRLPVGDWRTTEANR